ncbi:MAG TPA: WbqC family protein [Pyrinomonadaceae bacterium]|jgi:hypothetical protein
MRIAVMQPYLFPYIGYFQLLNAVDKFIVFDDVNFIKKGWINRNNILVNRQKYLFTVPLKDASQNKLIKEIEIAEGDWQEKFLKTVAQSYKKAEFFDETFALIEKIVRSGESFLAKLILQSLRLLKDALKINAEIVPSSEIYNNRELKAQDRILDICKQENATKYVNPMGGTELYDRQIFSENGVKLFFLKTQPFSYRQFGEEFAPNLSIIDVLMFNGFSKTREFLTRFTLE